jgi:uncharacterized damage-inducible protein DinB
MNSLVQNIIRQLKDVQNGKTWIGSNYEAKLDRIDETSAFIRPLPNLHSIAEIISHLSFWREETILKILTGKGSKTDACEENWLPNEALRKKGWEVVKSDYENSLTTLIDLLDEKGDSFLSQEYYDTDFKGYYPYEFLLTGMVQHDVYHLGQLGLILKLLNEPSTPQFS